MDKPAAEPELIAQYKAYQARLQAAGRLLEARAVARCIALARRYGRPH